MVDGVVETPNGAHFTSCVPDYGRDEAFQALLRGGGGEPGGWASSGPSSWPATRTATRRRWPVRGERGRRQRGHGRMTAQRTRPTRWAEVCVVACAEAWRGDGEILASPMGTDPDPRRPAGRSSPSSPTCCSPTARPRLAGRRDPSLGASRGRGRRGLDAVPRGLRRGGRGPAPRDDGRQPDRPVRQPEHLLHRRLGPARRRSCSASAARPATRSTTRPATGCPEHSPRVFVERVDMAVGVGYDRAGAGSAAGRRVSTSSAGSSPTWRCSTSRARTTACGCARCIPASPVDDVVEATGFALAVPDDGAAHPAADRRRSCALIREVSSTRPGSRDKRSAA